MWLTHVPDGGTQRAVKRARGSISCSLKGFLSSYHKRGPSFPRQIPIDCADGGYVRTVEAQLVKQIDLGIHSAKLKVGFRGDSILNFRTMAKSSKSNRTRTCQEHLETVFSSVFGPCDIDHQAWAGARVAEITKFIREGPSLASTSFARSLCGTPAEQPASRSFLDAAGLDRPETSKI